VSFTKTQKAPPSWGAGVPTTKVFALTIFTKTPSLIGWGCN